MKLESLIETKRCGKCSSEFQITDKDLEFYNKISPVFNSKKYPIPAPTLCPDCRQQRRLSFRNERKLYHRKCDLTGKQIISIYSPDKPYKVYEQSEWWSDKWDPLSYGREFDFNRSFFEQFGELNDSVPKLSLIQRKSQNSDYANDIEGNKNCYLCFTSWENEDSLFSTNIFWSKNCVDGFWISECENCYEGVNLVKCYGVYNSFSCFDCRDSYYLNHCKNTRNSMFSIGLENKEYYFLNKPITKDIFYECKKKIKTDKVFLNNCIIKFEELKQNSPRIYSNQTRCQNCEGDFLSDSADNKNVFDALYVENCKYVYQGGNLSEMMDVSVTGGNDLCSLAYEGLSAAGSNRTISTITVWNSSDVYYSSDCYNSSDLFGCTGLRNAKYCILNKQYSKVEYESLVEKIITHMKNADEWGEFFPSSISPFGYNETVASEYFPLKKEKAVDMGFRWSDYEKQNGYEGDFYEPLHISSYDETKVGKEIAEKNIKDLLNGILKCEKSEKPYRIIRQELDIYLKHDLPIPKRHPDQRHLDRMKLRNPRKLYERTCSDCGKQIKTTYSPERNEIIFCEDCYSKESING